MSAGIIEYLIGPLIMLIATLTAYDIIPLKVAEEKKEAAEKMKKTLKIVAPIGFVALTVSAILKFST